MSWWQLLVCAAAMAFRVDAAAAQTALPLPAAVDAGPVVVGQAGTRFLVLYNGGSGPLQVDAVTLSGAHASAFSSDAAPPFTVAPSSYQIVRVSFAPQSVGARTATLTVTSPGGSSVVPLSGWGVTSIDYRLNAGGTTYTDPSGDEWTPDDAWVSTGAVRVVQAPIAETFSDPLFASERWDPADAPELSYALPVTNGLYLVRLLFAETWEGAAAAGARVFDVSVEGKLVLDDYDVFASAGYLTATVKATTVLVSDGVLDVEFGHVVENPKVSGIEVASLSPPGPWLLVSPGQVSFGTHSLAGAPAERLVALINAGSAELEVTDVAVTGPAAGDFSHDATPPFTVPAGGWAMLTLTFDPTAIGARQASLEVTSDDPAAPGGVRAVALTGQAVETLPIQFTSRVFASAATPGAQNLLNPTSLMFGPDGRLYAAQQNGLIHVFTLGPGHQVTGAQLITGIFTSPTFDDDGDPAAGVIGRQVTGLYVDPASDPAAPVLYVAHSDPRIGANNDALARAIDTDGGVLTRLTGPNFDAPASRTDLVVGLPRSRENHAPNGIQRGPDGWLYLAIGGNTNYGAPSTFFSGLPEVNLSAGVVRLNLGALPAALPVDVSAGAQPGSGPGDGEQPGLFEVFATGYRNGYDLLWHSNGRLYLNTNEGNDGLGNTPGPADGCPTGQSMNPGTLVDKLFVVTAGAYGGHPVPARGLCVYGDGSLYGPPKSSENAYTPPLHQYANSSSTNGIAEYGSLAFDGQMLGDILTVATFGGDHVRRVELSADGAAVVGDSIIAAGLSGPIDLAVHPDGTIFVAELFASRITVLEPISPGTPGDNDSDGVPDEQDPDDDDDGYADADEVANGTDPFNPASVPPDFDGDFVSDLLDDDDDDDGTPDAQDAFAVDALDGAGTIPPLAFEWNPGDALLEGLDKSGFTGVQATSNGTGFLPGLVTVGAAGGFLAIVPTQGDMRGPANDQDNALQLGIDATPVDGVGPFTVSTRLVDPFVSPPTPPLGSEAAGVFLGLGEDDFVRLDVSADTGQGQPGILLSAEIDGIPTALLTPVPATLGVPRSFDLFLEVDPENGTIGAAYRIDSSAESDVVSLGTVDDQALPGIGRFFTSGLALGLAASRGGQPASGFVAVFDWFRIEPGGAAEPADTLSRGLVVVNTGGTITGGSTYTAGSFRVKNDSGAGQRLTRLRLDLRSAFLPDLIFDPDGTAGDSVGKPFTVDADPGVGLQAHALLVPHGLGWDVLDVSFGDFEPGEVLTFSVDVDPASIQGAVAPGPGEAGSVSGLELAGATLTAFFDDGTTHSARLYPLPGSNVASFAILAAGLPDAPSVRVQGVAVTPTAVGGAAQVVTVTGEPGQVVGVHVIEGARFEPSPPAGGPPLGLFDANSVVASRTAFVVVEPDGTVDVPVQLSHAGGTAGLNHVFAAALEAGPLVSFLSAVHILALIP